MCRVDSHQYQILTKRPERARAYIVRWLERTGRSEVPDHIWIGTSIEANRFAYRADVLREIPVPVRFISAEPLLEALPDLNLSGISWLIVGGESGPGFRRMDHAWARELLSKARAHGTAFYFKQSSAPRTEMGIDLDGIRYEEYPRDEPRGPRRKGGASRLLPMTP
jgi:protein gp37